MVARIRQARFMMRSGIGLLRAHPARRQHGAADRDTWCRGVADVDVDALCKFYGSRPM
jgi:hypothetical protein